MNAVLKAEDDGTQATPRHRIQSSRPVPRSDVSRARGTLRRGELEVLFTHDHGVKETFDAEFGRVDQIRYAAARGVPAPVLEESCGRARASRFWARSIPSCRWRSQRASTTPWSCTDTTWRALSQRSSGPRSRKTRVLLRSESNLLNSRPLGRGQPSSCSFVRSSRASTTSSRSGRRAASTSMRMASVRSASR
jgi:hypothetical protein